MDFDTKQTIILRINNIDYVMHKYIVKMMDIYTVMIDCDDKNFLEINWDISQININRALHLINCYLHVDVIENMDDKFEITSFIRYLGVNDVIMKKALKKLFKSETIYSFIDRYMPHDDIYVFILDKYIIENLSFIHKYTRKCNAPNDQLINLIDKIKFIDFTNELKTKLITKIVSAKIEDDHSYTYGYYYFEKYEHIYAYFGQPRQIDIHVKHGVIHNYPGIIHNGLLIVDDGTNVLDIIIKNIVATILRK